MVNIPRYWHGEQRCKDARTIELKKFEDYDAYEEILDQGQSKLGTNWVHVEKNKGWTANGKSKIDD